MLRFIAGCKQVEGLAKAKTEEDFKGQLATVTDSVETRNRDGAHVFNIVDFGPLDVAKGIDPAKFKRRLERALRAIGQGRGRDFIRTPIEVKNDLGEQTIDPLDAGLDADEVSDLLTRLVGVADKAVGLGERIVVVSYSSKLTA